jgi:DNA-binding MarR family transcriptional regulator
VGSSTPERLHHLMMEFIRAAGLLLLDETTPGQPVSLSQAFAIHELDTDLPLSQRELAERLRLEKSTVSRLAGELERKGLLVRERDPGNKRLYRLRLTDAGRAVHARMSLNFHEHYVQWVADMSKTERDALIDGLTAFVRVMRIHPPQWRH